MAELNPVSRFFVNSFAARRNGRRAAWIRRALSLPTGTDCLEVGCGNADLALRLVDALRPSRYVATDFDPRQVESARRHVASAGRTGPARALEVRTADMLRLPFESGSFDAAFAFSSLHHANPNHRAFGRTPQALAEISRVLRDRGVFVYEEFVQTDRVRAWLADHNFRVDVVDRGWRREGAIARRP